MKLSNLNLSDHEDYYFARFQKVFLKKRKTIIAARSFKNGNFIVSVYKLFYLCSTHISP